MNDNPSEAAYWHRVDAFINLANELSSGAVPDEVGASSLYFAGALQCVSRGEDGR